MDLNLGVNYQKIVNVKEIIVQEFVQKKEKNGGVFVPCTLDKDGPILFAIDEDWYTWWEKTTAWDRHCILPT